MLPGSGVWRQKQASSWSMMGWIHLSGEGGLQRQHELGDFWLPHLPLFDLAEASGPLEGHSIPECQADSTPKDTHLKQTASGFKSMTMHSVKMGESPDNSLFYTCFMEKPYTSSVNEKTYKQTKMENDIAQLRYFICEICTKCLDIIRKYPPSRTQWSSEKTISDNQSQFNDSSVQFKVIKIKRNY